MKFPDVSYLLSESDAVNQTRTFITRLLKNSLFELENVGIIDRIDAYTFIMQVELYLEDIHIITIKTDLRATMRHEDKLGYYLRDKTRRFWVETWSDKEEKFIFTEITTSEHLGFFKALSEEIVESYTRKADVVPIKD